MEDFFVAEDMEIRFFDGRLLSLGIAQINNRFSNFEIKPLQKLHKREWIEGLIPQTADWQIYDLYHNDYQKDKFASYLKSDSLGKIVDSLRTSLFFDPPKEILHKIELAEKAVNLFGVENIIKMAYKTQSESQVIKQSYFCETDFQQFVRTMTHLESETNVFQLNDPLFKQKVCKRDLQRLKKIKKTTLVLNQNRSIEETKLRTNNKLGLTEEDLELFLKQVPEYQRQGLTLNKMFCELKKVNPKIKGISFSSFYQRFIKEQNLVYRKPKISHLYFKREKKVEARKLNCLLISRILSSNEILYFYDESTINSGMCFGKAWFLKEQEKNRFIRAPGKFFKLNIVTNFKEIVSFSITTGSFDSEFVAKFLQSSAELIKKRFHSNNPVLLVLDNGPKNRTTKCIRLAEKNLIRYIFTTPTTPQHNFCECLFQVVKNKLGRVDSVLTSSIKGLTDSEVFHSLMKVMTNLKEEDFAGARRSYFHEMKMAMKI